MKKFGLIALIAAVAGCTSFMIKDIDTLSRLAGAATGQALMMAKLEPKAHNTIIEVTQVVRNVTPGTNETFVAVWGKEAEIYVDQLIEKSKLDKDAKTLVMSGVNTLCLGIDYLFAKHPEWKEDTDKVKTGIQGFCDGMLAVMKPMNEDPNAVSAAPVTTDVELDGDTLMYLKSKGCF